MTDEQLSALLRLKRYEQPPPGYFDQLLRNVHRRQRVELLRQPLWRIALDRVQTFFGEHSMGHLSYGGAMATALVLGVALIGVMVPGDLEPLPGGARPIAVGKPEAASTQFVTLQPQPPRLDHELQSVRLPVAHFESNSAATVPRYVIDTRPPSYDAPSQF